MSQIKRTDDWRDPQRGDLWIIVISIIFILSLITSCSKFPDLGYGYQLDYNGMNDISIIKCLQEGDAPTIFIHGHILDYSFDSTFIIVAERPRDSVPECTGTITGMTAKICNKAFEKSSFRQYWIVNKKEKSEYFLDTLSNLARYSNVYGPFKKDEYLRKRDELNLPPKLVLKEE